MTLIPTLDEFLAAPIEAVRAVAPATMILGVGGTRRQAAMAGVAVNSDEYAHMMRNEMVACMARLFHHGVQHIFTVLVAQSQWQEVTPGYRENLLAWINWGIAGAEALAEYASLGWQVRLCASPHITELHEASQRLEETTGHRGSPALWLFVTSDREDTWASILELCQRQSITTREEAIRALYGQEIPLATMFLGSGKPALTVDVVPPLLIGDVQCYWRQHLGYDLDERTIRTVFHDYAYLRRTWNADKSGRAEKILQYKDAWENPPIIGVGQKIGPFWFPR